MLIKRPTPGDSAGIQPSEITSEQAYLSRRELLQASLGAALGWRTERGASAATLQFPGRRFVWRRANQLRNITTHTIFLSAVPARRSDAKSGNSNIAWRLRSGGRNQGKLTLESAQSRTSRDVYRLRCWKLVVVIRGSASLSAICDATGRLPKAVVALKRDALLKCRAEIGVLDWRMSGCAAEAMNPWTLLAVGLQAKFAQSNGAPLR